MSQFNSVLCPAVLSLIAIVTDIFLYIILGNIGNDKEQMELGVVGAKGV